MSLSNVSVERGRLWRLVGDDDKYVGCCLQLPVRPETAQRPLDVRDEIYTTASKETDRKRPVIGRDRGDGVRVKNGPGCDYRTPART